MLVELKSGETFNGNLLQCDTYMNLTLREVIQTSRVSNHISSDRCCVCSDNVLGRRPVLQTA